MNKIISIFVIVALSLLFLVSCAQQPQEKAKITIVDEVELKNMSTEQNKTVSEPVSNVSQNVSTPVVEEKLTEIKVKETENVSLNVSSIDADGDVISYTFSSPLNSKGEWKTDHGDAGEYIITVNATDGKSSSIQKLKLIVEKVNVAPIFTRLSENISVAEGSRLSISPLAIDPNKDKVMYALSDSRFKEENATFNWDTSYTDRGNYSVELTASDGELKINKTIKITVTRNNVAPELTAEEKIVIKEGEEAVITVSATDLNKDPINITIKDIKFTKKQDNSFTWLTNYTSNGNYDIEIVANDGEKSTSKIVQLVVQDVNLPPQIVSIKAK